MPGVVLSIDQQAMQRVYSALKLESDGKDLRRDLTRELKLAIAPARVEAKAAIMAMPSADVRYGDMRQSISSHVKVSVRTAGRNTGVAVVANKGGYPRGFNNASAQFNRAGWRHPVFGSTGNWVTQVGDPGWFDRIIKNKSEYIEAVRTALVAMAERIAARSTTL